MKKVGDLMKDLGFNSDASNSAKEAFIKYLIKQSAGVDVQTPTEKKIIADHPEKFVAFPKQLSFEFEETETQSVKKVK